MGPARPWNMAVRLEERDLVSDFGDRYRRYRQRVPMLIPSLRGRTLGDEQPAG